MAGRGKKPEPLDGLFRALADTTRLRLLNLLSEREVCVCYFTEAIGAPQPKISRHLAYLRRAGIVAARRSGRWMHYRLVVPEDSHAAAIVRLTIAALEADPRMRRDAERFARACCGPRSLVKAIGAPAPSPARSPAPSR